MLAWTNSAVLVRPLLEGRFLRERAAPGSPPTDWGAFARWACELQSPNWQLRRAAALEIEARFRRFRRFCGITLWTYVTRLRLAEAQRLLATTDLSVLEVCHQAGFGSTSQMYDVFRRHRGVTPARYRGVALAEA